MLAFQESQEYNTKVLIRVMMEQVFELLVTFAVQAGRRKQKKSFLFFQK